MTNYDAIVIGTGQAGPYVTSRLAGAGMKVAVVERNVIGGTCVKHSSAGKEENPYCRSTETQLCVPRTVATSRDTGHLHSAAFRAAAAAPILGPS